MRAKWLIGKIKTVLKYSCFMLTVVLVTQRLLEENYAQKEQMILTQTTKAFVRKEIRDDVPFQVVFDVKSSQNEIRAKHSDSTRFTPGLLRVLGFGYDIFLFSAVVGNSSSGKNWDTIVIQGWEQEMYENTSFGCCIQYKSGEFLSVSMTKKVHWAYRHMAKMPVKQYICPNPRHEADGLPEYVTISGLTKQTACHTRFNWYLKPYFAHSRSNEIAVCTKVIYGGVTADDLLTWFEIHRRLGVTKVLSYIYNLNPEATKVLQYYKSQGILESFPFNLPKASRGRNVTQVGVKNFQAWNDEQIPVYDCFEKLKGYKYLAVLDIDEYLVPKERKTWTELFVSNHCTHIMEEDNLWKVRPYAAGFSFLVQIHVTSWNVTNTSSRFTAGRYINCTSAMVDRPKHVTRPDRLIDGGLSTHQFTPQWDRKFKRFQAKESDATIHHFRSCRKEWNKRPANMSCMNLMRFRDTSVANMLAPLEQNIIRLKSSILEGD